MGWQYDYWPTGERAAKTNLTPTPDVSELYVPRFNDVATEYSQLGAGAITFENRYVQGTGIDSKTTRIDAAGTLRRHYLGDAVGTVALTLDEAGGIAEQTIRDVWGNKLSAGNSAERYGFAQREHDNESSLVHMRARYYDPRTGRFTQCEPLGPERASQHYLYANSAPCSTIDPLGLQPSLPFPSGGILSDTIGLRAPLSSCSSQLNPSSVHATSLAATNMDMLLANPMLMASYKQDLWVDPWNPE